MRRSVLLSIRRWNIISAKLISLCPNLECTSTVWAVSYTHAKYGQLSRVYRPYHRRLCLSSNSAEIIFHAFRCSLAAHALLLIVRVFPCSRCQSHSVTRKSMPYDQKRCTSNLFAYVYLVWHSCPHASRVRQSYPQGPA